MKRDIHLERVYFHPRDLVWRALTDSELIGQWLMENDFAPEKGRRFTLRTKPGPGFDGVVRAEVLDIEPPSRMRWSWRGGPIDTEVTFTLTEEIAYGREATRLRVDHTGFEGLPAVLVSFILGAGNARVYGEYLPAVLRRLSGEEPSAEVGHGGVRLWSALQRLFAPILRRARPAPGRPPR